MPQHDAVMSASETGGGGGPTPVTDSDYNFNEMAARTGRHQQ